jgi:hypothetical protein
MTDSEVVEEASRGTIELVLRRTAGLTLRLQPPAGRATPTWCRVLPPVEDLTPHVFFSDQLDWSDGVVEWPSWDPRQKTAQAFVPGYEVVEVPVAVRPGEHVQLPTVSLVPAGRVRGRVVDDGDQPVPGAQVSIEVLEGDWAFALPSRSVDTDADGAFEIELAAPQEANVMFASAPGFMTTAERLYAPGTPQLLRLRRGETFRGRLVGAERPARWIVRFVGGGDEPLGEASVQPDGTFAGLVSRRPFKVVAECLDPRERFRCVERKVPAYLADDAVFEVPVGR